MNRLLVIILAAFDAAIAAVVGVAAALAPLTLLWVFGFGGAADWGLLWPAAARIWQAGNLVPVQVTLPAEYLTATGIPEAAAAFTVSLAPLAFATFTALFAARSGARAAHSGAGLIGVLSGTVAFGALAALCAVSSHAPVASVEMWQAIAVPTLVYLVPAAVGAFATAWREGDDGLVDDLHDRADRTEVWRGTVDAAARGLAAAVVGAIGLGAAVLAVALAVGGGDVVALFEAAHVDVVGAITVALAQIAYLPTLVVWGLAYAAGPGFLLGEGATVSAAGTDLGVLPAIPVLGIVPEAPSHWLLLLAVAVVGIGALAGWIARARLVRDGADAVPARLAILAALAVGSGLAAAVLAVVASGSIGPGRLAVVGPQAGPLALAVGAEIAVGAAIMLFGPRRRSGETDPHEVWLDEHRLDHRADDHRAERRTAPVLVDHAEGHADAGASAGEWADGPVARGAATADPDGVTEPIEPLAFFADDRRTPGRGADAPDDGDDEGPRTPPPAL
ncbi:DUF6350 family protein [Microbacterium sp. W1N]|uniref:cell division protein PerM n=1 Tax=Microbacterium festucae TaxID=2977531 RepID=UPI0021C119B8|nr:DUF6350 family protein [Microbacterium festucae]MCT9818895.1 DUF6350 family protein [Microbacterium festucae]